MSKSTESERTADRRTRTPASGTVGVLGGLFVVVWSGAIAVIPGDAVPLAGAYALAYVSAAVLGYACIGLFAALAVRGDPGRFAHAGVASVVAGLVLLGGGLVAGVVAPALVPVFAGPGGVAALVGMVALVWAARRADLLPRWAAFLFVVATALLLLFRPGGPAAALAVPFGVAWVVVGSYLRALTSPSAGSS